MAQDPAFLFYPGDYLRDTQCLSEESQVAYDRIMCEHMRNICISQERLTFFTKRLNVEQRAEILSVLKVVDGGFEIPWVVESIRKRREYSDSRRKNRSGSKKDMNDTSKTYVPHMENVIEIESVIENKSNKERIQEIGERSNFFVSIKTKYLKDVPKRIWNLETYFEQTQQLQQIKNSDWGRGAKFSEFMETNAGRSFDDDDHLYASFRKFCTDGPQTKVNGTRIMKSIDHL